MTMPSLSMNTEEDVHKMKEQLLNDKDIVSNRKRERVEKEQGLSVSLHCPDVHNALTHVESECSAIESTTKESTQQSSDDTFSSDRKRKKTCRYKVSFGEDLIIPVKAYVTGHSDAEILSLHHHDIWYTNKDYANFLQDRIDTIRVYRSVNGNMKSLSKYYTIRGLEHHLRHQSHHGFQLEQQSLISAILNEQKLQTDTSISNPYHCLDNKAHILKERSRSLTASALDRALQLAAIDAEHLHDETEDETDEDSCCSDNDSCGDVQEEISLSLPRVSHTAMSLCSSYQLPELSIRRNNWHSNVPGLMNTRVSDTTAASLSLASSLSTSVSNNSSGKSSDEEIAKALQAVDKELQLWNDLQRTHHLRRDSLCAPSSSSTALSLSSQMSKSMPRLFDSPMYLQQYPISVPMHHCTSSTTRVSSVRRDSLAGLQHSCNSGL